MSSKVVTTLRRPTTGVVALLATLAYLPALTAAPGKMPADSKLYLYLDPGRFLGDAASTFDARQFAGWVPHQHISYLWPAGPWFWFFETIGVPDWIAHRLWIGSLMLAAGLGVRWCSRILELSPVAAATAAVVYQLSLYVLPYVSRTSVMLLPWAGLGWIVALTVRASRRRSWADPALIALVVLTVGAVNATALAMIVPAPVLWLLHETWRRALPWRDAIVVATRTGLLSLGVSAWWVVMLIVQGRDGVDVLPYSESLADVSLTATSTEVWRSLGYWLFYVRDPAAATTTESLRYLTSTPAIVVSFALPICCLIALVFVRWPHRRFAGLLVVTGAMLAVGVHPVDDRSPLMRVLAGSDDAGLALALRSSTRAIPVMMLGLALAAGALVTAVRRLELRGVAADRLAAAAIGALALVNVPGLWTGAWVDPALEREEHPPDAWLDAAAELDASGSAGRVLQVPGAEFGAFRWGYTVDQPLPGLTEKPLITRDLLPLGSPGAMDLLYALDDRIQDNTLEAESIAPVARLLGADTVWVTGDAAFDRFRTARPAVVADALAAAPGLERATPFGDATVNRPDVAMTDERSLADQRVGTPLAPVILHRVEQPGAVVRARPSSVIVSGSGAGLVDAAASGVLTDDAAVRYSASIDESELDAALAEAGHLVVTDTNRDRARHWRGSQDTHGFTESAGRGSDVLREVPSDQRLPVFTDETAASQTVSQQEGPVRASASSYGEPFAYLPEHRPVMAIDGDSTTSWLVGEHGDPIGEFIRLTFEQPEAPRHLRLLQPDAPRRITAVTVIARDADGSETTTTASLDDRSVVAPGQTVELPPDTRDVDVVIDAVGGGSPGTAGAVAAVGFAEMLHGVAPTVEVIRPPHDALARLGGDVDLTLVLTRLRADPMDRWRDDPEPDLIRAFELGDARSFQADVTVRIDPRASDESLARLFGWPAVATSRLTGSIRSAGVSAVDGALDTAWVTAFDSAVGSTLSVEGVAEPVTQLTVHPAVGEFSALRQLVVAAGDDRRTLDMPAGGTEAATFVLEPPLPAGPLDITITEIEPATTIDRRFGDRVELPAAIAEIEIPGLEPSAPVGATPVDVPCTPLLAIDDVVVEASLVASDPGWSDGRALTAEVCSGAIGLDAGEHTVHGGSAPAPFVVDRVTLRGEAAGRTGIDRAPNATQVDAGRFDRSIEVSNCDDGCWLVLGEGYSTRWRARLGDVDLGDPTMVDGGFNGWWIEPGRGTRTVTARWTSQGQLDAAIAVSAASALLALGLLVRSRFRPAPVRTHRDAVPALDDLGGPTGNRLVSVAAWVILPVVLIGPVWGVWGALAGAAGALTRRRRLGELVALAAVVTLGAAVTVIERRNAPFPNGGWPAEFEHLHGIGMFALVALLVGVVTEQEQADRAAPVDDPGASGSERDPV